MRQIKFVETNQKSLPNGLMGDGWEGNRVFRVSERFCCKAFNIPPSFLPRREQMEWRAIPFLSPTHNACRARTQMYNILRPQCVFRKMPNRVGGMGGARRPICSVSYSTREREILVYERVRERISSGVETCNLCREIPFQESTNTNHFSGRKRLRDYIPP